MKKVIALAALAALVGSAYAQLNPLPPLSSTNGVTVQSIGVNAADASNAHWNNTSTLGAYNYSGDGTSVHIGAPDNVLGLNWSKTINANISAALSKLNLIGGSVRVIFAGEDAGWKDSFGYTTTGNPSSVGKSFTIFNSIEANGPTPINTVFGDHADINVGIGQASTFDFWYSATGQNGQYGGVYTTFNPASTNVKFASTPLMVNTWVAANGDYENVATYLTSYEDWDLTNVPNPNLIDYSDLMVGFQFYNPDGTPFTPVPEPSTYGLIGAAALLGLVFARRFKAKK